MICLLNVRSGKRRECLLMLFVFVSRFFSVDIATSSSE
jgi:hypothetical protein